MGAPVFLSFPHFYNADPYYVDAVEGLSPNKEEHELYIIVEPVSTSMFVWNPKSFFFFLVQKTGVIADISAKMQINILLQPIPTFS